MGETTESRVRLGTSTFGSLFPRFPEPIAPEMYRLTGKYRAVLVLVMLAMNVITGLSAESLALDGAFYWRLHIPNTAILVSDLLLGLLIWRGGLTTPAMRRATYACLLLESSSMLLTLWSYGSVSSQMVMFGFLLILAYRGMFDFATGLLAFVVLLVGHWGVVIAEVAGWVRPQPLNPGSPDYAYLLPSRQIGAMMAITVIMAITFWAANWTVVRLRHKERAIRILRETLAATGGGELGRHTGQTLKDTYVVGPLIGRGGMGEVYSGHHRRTRRKVAIKILYPHLVDDPLLRKRFRREAEIAGALGSEHIVEIIDIDVDQDQPFLVLELLEGESLDERIAREGPLPFDVVAEVVSQIARGVAKAHAASVIHRDLKPANILLTPRPAGFRAKILDFGVSKIRGEATAITQEVALLGTPDFMSPEQAIGVTEDLDTTTDVFALGGIAYCLLTGVRPFRATSVPALLGRICDEEPIPVAELRTDVPAGVADVLTIAMAKRRSERYVDVAALARDLAAALAGDPPPSLAARAARVYRGRPATRSEATKTTWVSPTARTANPRQPDGFDDTIDSSDTEAS